MGFELTTLYMYVVLADLLSRSLSVWRAVFSELTVSLPSPYAVLPTSHAHIHTRTYIHDCYSHQHGRGNFRKTLRNKRQQVTWHLQCASLSFSGRFLLRESCARFPLPHCSPPSLRLIFPSHSSSLPPYLLRALLQNNSLASDNMHKL